MKRRLSHSQNFFRETAAVRELVGKVNITTEDVVVEIGSGKGIITLELAKKARKVIAVEVDKQLYSELIEKLRGLDNVELINADFMTWALPRQPYKVFANIPFNMTAEIVGKLIGDEHSPELTYLIMQEKATERFVGQPVAKDTQISILLKNEFEAEIIAKISRREFMPKPMVDAVLLMLRKRDKPLIEIRDRQIWRDFVVYGYNQWKPTVLEAFVKIFSHEQRQKLEQVVGRKTKPREVRVEQWVALFEYFKENVADDKKVLVAGAERKLKMRQDKLQKIHRTR